MVSCASYLSPCPALPCPALPCTFKHTACSVSLRRPPLTWLSFVCGVARRIPELKARAAALKVGAGSDPKADLGPMISAEAKARALSLIQSGVDCGAKLLLDGRNVSVCAHSLLSEGLLHERSSEPKKKLRTELRVGLGNS
jgi:hypothetical protein